MRRVPLQGVTILTGFFVGRTGVADWALSLLPSGDRWGARRRLFHEVMSGSLTRNFDSHHLKYVHRFLSHLLEAPESFMQEAELYVSYPLSDPSPHPSLNIQASLEPLSCP